MKWFTKKFALPAAAEIARRELEDAQRELLTAQSGAEYAARMVEYHQARIKRLKAYIAQENAPC